MPLKVSGYYSTRDNAASLIAPSFIPDMTVHPTSSRRSLAAEETTSVPKRSATVQACLSTAASVW
jgi:hypothetical protein